MISKATSLGLGTCYIGWMDKDKVKKILNILDKYLVPYAITAGFYEDNSAIKPRPKKEIKEIIF